MSLIQIEKGVVESPDLNLEQAIKLYDFNFAKTKSLMENKNHDYGAQQVIDVTTERVRKLL